MSTATKKAPSLQPLLLSVYEVAQLLKCSYRQVFRLTAEGRMPSDIRLGKLRRWSREAIEEWIADGCPECQEAAVA